MSSNTTRLTALDYARAWAIFGMIIVNYKLAMEVGDHGANWLQTIAGLFEGRASALFVVLAGIGVSLMTAKASISRNQHMIRENRKTLVKRAVFLFIAGTLLLLTGWSADILHYYAVFLLLASVLITVSDKTLLILTGLALIVSSSMLILLDYSKGWDPGFHRYADFWTVEGFIRNLMFNGYHPLFPWISFFLIGMWLGRKGWWSGKHRRKLMMYSLLGAVIFELLSCFLIRGTSPWLDADSASYLFTTKPMPPMLLYVCSAACLAVAVITICFYIVERFEDNRLTGWLIWTGQLSLSHYLGHIFIGLGLLEAIGYLNHGNLGFAVSYGCGYFVMAVIFSWVWRKRVRRGPMELLMRKWC
ncbi:DUF418 domain-containing protein [Paenibacillus lautus]|uniref:DUF418 domain-containing protein n=1 Tax=Paenibacillus lautus TaxID=1401 RepID=UPI001C108492|nr:heparan-alpha-glucosaminide N-acetyltransferase domain-containing protein [Paenibacillus lautus]MBU5347737.1 DUF1624 domain-containing protein [Paenibacillus lautus]